MQYTCSLYSYPRIYNMINLRELSFPPYPSSIASGNMLEIVQCIYPKINKLNMVLRSDPSPNIRIFRIVDGFFLLIVTNYLNSHNGSGFLPIGSVFKTRWMCFCWSEFGKVCLHNYNAIYVPDLLALSVYHVKFNGYKYYTDMY